MTRPTARILAMLELLQTGRQQTVGDIAARLGVDERTVRRYAEHLADLGIPIHAQRGRYGGYRLSPGYKLPPLMLTEDEAVAVVLGLTAAERAGLATTEHAATASALAKVSRVLPPAWASGSTASSRPRSSQRRCAPPLPLAPTCCSGSPQPLKRGAP